MFLHLSIDVLSADAEMSFEVETLSLAGVGVETEVLESDVL